MTKQLNEYRAYLPGKIEATIISHSEFSAGITTLKYLGDEPYKVVLVGPYSPAPTEEKSK